MASWIVSRPDETTCPHEGLRQASAAGGSNITTRPGGARADESVPGCLQIRHGTATHKLREAIMLQSGPLGAASSTSRYLRYYLEARKPSYRLTAFGAPLPMMARCKFEGGRCLGLIYMNVTLLRS